MFMKQWKKMSYFLLVWIMFSVIGLSEASAHCDSIDGPVITAAKKALESGKIEPVLIWVQKKDETEIKNVFQKTLAVRKQGKEAKELADYYFFETLVRIHRAGEGESYTGLKPAGTEIEPGIEMADDAIEKGMIDPVAKEITEQISNEIKEKFNHVMETKKHTAENVESGRKYVAAYVEFIHYIESIHQLSSSVSHHHSEAIQKSDKPETTQSHFH